MATAPQVVDSELQQMARKHLWMHFSRMGAYERRARDPDHHRGEGCYVYDEHGNRYLDGLSALFCVNAGHGRTEYGEAAARQIEELDFFTLWSYAHPRGDRTGGPDRQARPRRPQPRLLHRRRLRGGRVGAEARAQLPPRPRQRPEAQVHRPRGRLPRHLLGALSATGITELRTQFEPLTPGGCHVPNTNIYRCPGTGPDLGSPTRSRSGSSSRGRRPSPR